MNLFKTLIILIATLLTTNVALAGVEISVNGVEITSEQIDQLDQQIKAKTGKQILRKDLLSSLVRSEVIKQKAYKLGLNTNPEVVKKTQDFKDQLVIDAYISSLISKIKITDKEYKKAYKKIIKNTPKKQYKASHILVKKSKEAKKIIKSLGKKNANFADIAKQKSIGPSAKNGGSLGWFTPKSMVKEFSTAVKKLKKNKYTKKPVKTKFGYHVILLEDVKKTTPPKFEEIKPNLTNQLMQPKLLKKVEAMVKKAKIKIF